MVLVEMDSRANNNDNDKEQKLIDEHSYRHQPMQNIRADSPKIINEEVMYAPKSTKNRKARMNYLWNYLNCLKKITYQCFNTIHKAELYPENDLHPHL